MAPHRSHQLDTPAISRAWVIPAVTFLVAFFFVPIGFLIRLSVFNPDFSLDEYAHLFREPAYFNVLLVTLKIAVSVTLATSLLGYPYAYVMYRARGAMKLFLFGIVLLPFFTSLLVRTFAFMMLLQDQGPLNQFLMQTGLISQPLPLMYNFFGVLFGMTYMLLPYFVLPLYSTLARTEPMLEQAARGLGASNLRAALDTTIPLSMSGALSGSALVLMLALGFFVTPALLGGAREQTLSMLIADQVNQLLNWSFAAALCVVLVIAASVLGGLLYAMSLLFPSARGDGRAI